MENYEEKLHNETLAIARSLMEKDPSLKDWVISKFPELAENKDEKIRKRIIEWIEEIRKCNPSNAEHNGNCSEAIAWLEKQGEQKPIEWDESIIDETISLINTLASGYGEKVDEPITFNGVKMINNIKERLRAIKPQPKKEWSEKDEKMFALISDMLWESYKQSDVEPTWDEIRTWCKSIKDRCVPQKQEWSEEDYSMLARIMFCLKTRVFPSTIDIEEMLDWLKSLEPNHRNL